MDREKQINELTVLLNRAKRSGLKVHHYPEQHLVIFRVLPEEVPAPAPVAAVPATATQAPLSGS